MPGNEVFRFADFTLDVGERRLLQGSQTVHLSPKCLDVLAALVREHGRLVTKHDLLERVWRGAFVDEGILTVHVAALRKAFASSSDRWIETVPRAGYRFTASVTRVRPAPVDDEAATPVKVYELVATGRSSLLAGSSATLSAALSAFRAAVDIDSSYAPAHAGLALTYCALANLRMVAHGEAYAAARGAALRALAMDSTSADAQTALGTVLFRSEWDWTGAERSLHRALEIDPDHTEALLEYGALNDALGNGEWSLQLKQQALAGAPDSPLVLLDIALTHAHLRNFDEAIVWARKALARDAKNERAAHFLALTFFCMGDVSAFIIERRRWAEACGVPAEVRVELEEWLAALQRVFARGGHEAATRFVIERLRKTDDSLAAFQRAACCAGLGDIDAAFECLDHAIALRDPYLVYLGVQSVWDPLRNDPRMLERLSRIGLPNYAVRKC